MKPGDKVLIFDKHIGVIKKGPVLPQRHYVEYKANGTFYRAYVADTDVKLVPATKEKPP